MNAPTSKPSADEVIQIIADLDTARIGQLFTGNSLLGLHEPIIEAMRSRNWLGMKLYEPRANFLQAMRPYTNQTDDYRRLFMAMAESGHVQGVLGMLHATGRKDRVFAGNQPLLTMGTLAGLVLTHGKEISPVIHFLTRAAAATLPDEPAALIRTMIKHFNPTEMFAGKWLEAIQGMVKARTLGTLGFSGEKEKSYHWLESLVTTEDAKQMKVSASVVAGLMAKGDIKLDDLKSVPFDDLHKIRLVKELGIAPEALNIQHISSSRSRVIEPSFRL